MLHKLNKFSSYLCHTPKIILLRGTAISYTKKIAFIVLVQVVFIDVNTLTGSRNFKKFLKESYFALDSCSAFTKKMLLGIEHNVNSAYGVYIIDIPELCSTF